MQEAPLKSTRQAPHGIVNDPGGRDKLSFEQSHFQGLPALSCLRSQVVEEVLGRGKNFLTYRGFSVW